MDNNASATYAQSQADGTSYLNQYDAVGGATVKNGAHHEITNYAGASYTYINDGRLSQVTGTGPNYILKYDALGRVVARTSGTNITYFYYDGEKAIMEFGSIQASNIYGLGVDEIVVRFQNDGHSYFFYQDHEGSVTHVQDNLVGFVEQYRYDAYGTPAIRDGNGKTLTKTNIGNRFMFTGREYNQTYGFYEYRARAYHPVLGRFMSEDPKGFDAGDYNLFRYCGNDPEDHVDPMGLEINFAQTGAPVSGNHTAQALTIEEKISLWQKSMESSIGGERAANFLQNVTMAQMSQAPGQGKGGVPARYVPVLDKSGKPVIIDYGLRKGFEFQLVDSKGRPFKEYDLKNEETRVGGSGPNSKTIASGQTRINSQGILMDVVGPVRQPSPQTDRTITNTMSNRVFWNGFPFPISTQFKQETVIQHGSVIRITDAAVEPQH